jgi:dipeptidase D
MWEHFFALSAIPRPSGAEEGVRRYLKGIASASSREWVQDGAGNVVLRVPGNGSLAGAEVLILQGHMDMICEKSPGLDHDFSRDPLRLRVEGGWIRAEGTTLGADNGIGIAMALAAAEADLPDRVPLELLMTIDEETGLTGAMELDPAILRGRRLINLDSEKEGVLIVGCAGGTDLSVRFRREQGDRPPERGVRCRVGGLRGGHSGINIHENRANAILVVAALLERLGAGGGKPRLHSFRGGTKKNAIPREGEFIITGVPAEEIEEAAREIGRELVKGEPEARIVVTGDEEVRGPPLPWAIIDFLREIPNGVIAMDSRVEGLVHTSSNVGVLESDEEGASLRFHLRSSDDARRDREAERIFELARRRGGETATGGSYPGWIPNPESCILRNLEKLYREISGRQARVEGIHAGLEAGVIGALLGTEELVSFGPDIENAHSPGERLSIASAEQVYRLLERFVSSPACSGALQEGPFRIPPGAHGGDMSPGR